MKKLRRELLAVTEGILLFTIGVLMFVLLYSAGLVAFDIDPACAEVKHWPLAYVDVNADSYLNVRKTPAGELCTIRLESMAEVVLLETDGSWALVIRPEHLGRADMNGQPLGWVSMDYLRVYRDHMTITK